MPEPLSPALRVHLDRVWRAALDKGHDPWEALNAAGLLLTEPTRRLLRNKAVVDAMDDLDAMSVPQLLGNATYQKGATAGDMRTGIRDRLWEIAARMAKQVR